MSEKRILIASLLKPVNDTRMFGKLGLSLSRIPEARVHIAGFEAPTPADAPAHIIFHPVFRFRRLSLGRAAAQLAFYRLLQEIKPQLLIVCTHELLLASHIYCRRHNCKLLYDVQENYTLNLKAQDNYAPWLKQVLALGVGSIEKSLAKHIAHFLVAERSYVQELPFLGQRYTVIENKYNPPPAYTTPSTPVNLKHKPLRLLYSGTIARLYGIFEAIALADQLYILDPQITFIIIGYCAEKASYKEVLRQVQGKPYITLTGGDQLVPHQRIVQAISESNLGLLPYQPNKSTFRCMPTKLYEYAAHALPMVVQENPLWHAFLQQHQAGLSVDFAAADARQLLKQVREAQFYEPGVPSGVFWEEEQEKLIHLVNQLI
jgi:glycosyltransferase involved in cell wall biosynthesis